ncbi:universal stress protein [Nonomuraea sp. NPDC049152]|uniref:universal stress protein n=1 Tax=Nonomuraea sp. NPDC049152 TaxID=3154350 RepID=UPI003409B047
MSEHDERVPQLDLPGPAPGPAETLLVVGYDRHPAGRAALVTAADLAVRLEASLLVVHVVDLADHPIDPDAADWDTRAQAAAAAERDEVGVVLADHPLPWTSLTRRGDPARQLLDLAGQHHAMMIVVGAARTGLSAHLLTGSVVKHLTRHIDRPILIVPDRPAC